MFEPEKVFTAYTHAYRQYGDRIVLKIDHSFRVRGLCQDIARSICLRDDETELSAVCGLFHDIGRFEQWRRYQTFNDAQSVDHGDLGAEVLKDSFFDGAFPAAYRNTVIITAEYHNKYRIPDTLNDKDAFITGIVRDADKIDILSLYATRVLMKSSNNTAISDPVYNALLGHQEIRSKDIKTKADRTAVYLAFVFGFGFKRSFEIVKENGYIDRIIDIQKDEASDEKLKIQLEYLREHLKRYMEEKTYGWTDSGAMIIE